MSKSAVVFESNVSGSVILNSVDGKIAVVRKAVRSRIECGREQQEHARTQKKETAQQNSAGDEVGLPWNRDQSSEMRG
jgi:hypothetical protein